MDIFKIAAIGVVAALLAMVVKRSHPEIVLQISIAAGAVIFLLALGYLRTAVDFVAELANRFPIALESVTLILKIVGMGYVCQFIVSILRDAGETGVAAMAELAGKVVIVAVSLPLLASFLDLVLGILE